MYNAALDDLALWLASHGDSDQTAEELYNRWKRTCPSIMSDKDITEALGLINNYLKIGLCQNEKDAAVKAALK